MYMLNNSMYDDNGLNLIEQNNNFRNCLIAPADLDNHKMIQFSYYIFEILEFVFLLFIFCLVNAQT